MADLFEEIERMKNSDRIERRVKGPDLFEEIERMKFESIPKAGVSGTAKDAALSFFGKGFVQVGEAAVGLSDIFSLGRTGKALEKLGYDPVKTSEILTKLQSPKQQARLKRLAEAEGFLGKSEALLRDPIALGHTALEAAPLTLAGGGVARMFIRALPGLSPILAGAIGEGIVSAGAQAEGTRQQTEDGLLTLKQSAINVISGIGTGAFAVAGGSVARKLGINDIDTLLGWRRIQGRNSDRNSQKNYRRWYN